MKKLILLGLLLISTGAVFTTSAADHKHPMTVEVRKVKGFETIAVSEGIDVYITQAPQYRVVVKSHKDLVSSVRTVVKNGTLHIDYDKSARRRNNKRTIVELSMPVLSGISASSGSDVTLRGIFEGSDLKIATSSASDIEGTIHYKSVTIAASSGSDVELRGEVEVCGAVASSGSDIDLEGLICHTAEVAASSGSDISVHVTYKVNAVASSGSEVEIYGNPSIVDVSKSSGGSIRHKR